MSGHADGLFGNGAFNVAVVPGHVNVKPLSNDRHELLPLRPEHVVQLGALSAQSTSQLCLVIAVVSF